METMMETPKIAGDMLDKTLEVGKRYLITQKCVMDPYSSGSEYKMVAEIASAERFDYSVVYGTRSKDGEGRSCFGYLWDVPRWARQFHMRIVSAEEAPGLELGIYVENK